MTERNMKLALEEAKKVVGMIEADALTDAQKEAIIKESIANFNENVNPGWLEYRKSVSTDSAFVEWEDEGEVFLGRSMAKAKHMSDETAHAIDEEVRAIVNRNYARARQILIDNMDSNYNIINIDGRRNILID